jgi:hypothetical protein
LGRAFTGWIAPAFGWRTHSITSSARVEGLGQKLRMIALHKSQSQSRQCRRSSSAFCKSLLPALHDRHLRM